MLIICHVSLHGFVNVNGTGLILWSQEGVFLRRVSALRIYRGICLSVLHCYMCIPCRCRYDIYNLVFLAVAGDECHACFIPAHFLCSRTGSCRSEAVRWAQRQCLLSCQQHCDIFWSSTGGHFQLVHPPLWLSTYMCVSPLVSPHVPD